MRVVGEQSIPTPSTLFQESVRMSHTQGVPLEQSRCCPGQVYLSTINGRSQEALGWTRLSVFEEMDIEVEVGETPGL